MQLCPATGHARESSSGLSEATSTPHMMPQQLMQKHVADSDSSSGWGLKDTASLIIAALLETVINRHQVLPWLGHRAALVQLKPHSVP